MSIDKLVVRGAREHNLKNVSIELPRDALVVFTGLSGSGKSSLAFDTIFAEGQRRYVESLSAYARQFLGQMDKPDVDEPDVENRTLLNTNNTKDGPTNYEFAFSSKITSASASRLLTTFSQLSKISRPP